MSDEIKIDSYEEMKNKHMNLESARSGIAEFNKEDHGIQQNKIVSNTTKDFISTVEQLKQILVSYENLLWCDSQKLAKAIETYRKQDETLSQDYSQYQSSATASLKGMESR